MKAFVRIAVVALAPLFVVAVARLGSRQPAHADFLSNVGHLGFESPQTNPIAVSPDGNRIFVCNTANDTLSILDATRRALIAEVPVGLQPVSVAVRPDGAVVYVANHLSDSISVVDPSRGVILATIQEVAAAGDPNNPPPDKGITHFNEPCQIAFSPDGARAFVALSEMNQVAVIDAQAHAVVSRIDLNGTHRLPDGEHATLEDPRAIALLDGGRYLAVAAFESGNRTELQYIPGIPGNVFPGACDDPNDPIDLRNLVIQAELVIGFKGDVIENRAIPDRDLVVIRVADSQPVALLQDVGTLLYGLASPPGSNLLYVTHTDARNAANGFEALERRPWLNRISGVAFDPATETFGPLFPADLDAAPDAIPDPAEPAAVPYGLAISPDGTTCYVTAAGSDQLLFVDGAGAVLQRVVVGANPTGVAVNASRGEVYVLNRLDGTVSIVDATSGASLDTVSIGADPTPADVRDGAKVVHSASFSRNGSFSCASCHPAGAQDQLAWDLGGQDPNGIDIVGPRVTQSLRGLDGTAKFHWDGFFPTLHELVKGTIEGPVMSGTIDDALALEGEAYLKQIPHVPGPHRKPSDLPSLDAVNGLGHFVGFGCAVSGCHEAPFWTSPGQLPTGIEAVSVRALNDRNQILHDGVNSNLALNQCYGLYQGRIDSDVGLRSFLFTFFDLAPQTQNEMLAFFDETATGLPGALGAQVTLSAQNLSNHTQHELFFRIWNEITVGKALLTVDGWWNGRVVHYEYSTSSRRFVGPTGSVSLGQLARALRRQGAVLTFTARLAKPAEGPAPELTEVRLDPNTPTFGTVLDVPMNSTVDATFKGRHFQPGAKFFVDGLVWPIDPTWVDEETLTLHIDDTGGFPDAIFALQIQNPLGRFSNELPVRTIAPPN